MGGGIAIFCEGEAKQRQEFGRRDSNTTPPPLYKKTLSKKRDPQNVNWLKFLEALGEEIQTPGIHGLTKIKFCEISHFKKVQAHFNQLAPWGRSDHRN